MENSTESSKEFGCSLDAMSAISCLANSFYIIPPYQRGFKWGKPEIRRLLEEIGVYYQNYVKKDENDKSRAKFVGTIIRVPADPEIVNDMLDDKSAGHLKCKILIDGQQRLTFFSLLVICLIRRAELYYNELDSSYFGKLIKDNIVNNPSENIRKFIKNSLIKEMFESLANSDPDYLVQHLARQKEDKIRSEKRESFKSVVSELVYVEWRRKKSSDTCYKDITRQTLKIFSSGNEYNFKAWDKENYKNFETAINLIENFIDLICCPGEVKNNDDNIELAEALKDIHFTADSFVDAYQQCCFSINDPKSTEVIRLSFFWKFLKEYVFLAIVDCDNDNELDIFEALNTTGRALSPVETFVPDVFKYFNSSEKMDSKDIPDCYFALSDKSPCSGNVSINDILTYLRESSASDSADSVLPTKILTSFALIINGTKLEKALSAQRLYLKKTFDKIIKQNNCLKQVEDVINFLTYLDITTRWHRLLNPMQSKENRKSFISFYTNNIFIENYVSNNSQGITNKDFDKLERQAKLSLVVLQESNYVLLISIACRFYIAYLTASSDLRFDAYIEFLKALRALVAFTAIWISSHDSSTAGIEGRFREVLSGKSKLCLSKKFIGLALYSSNPLEKNTFPLCSSDLKFILKCQLSREFSGNFTCEEWKKRLKTSKTALRMVITKFLIFCSWHNTMSSDTECGMRQLSNKFSNKGNDFLNLESWLEYSNYDLEHVLPQTPTKEWDDLINTSAVDIESIIQCIGNVTLLPYSLNRALGNSGWDKKKNGLNALILKTPDAKAKFLEGLTGKEKDMYKEFLEKSDVQIEESLKELANVDLWNQELIFKRTNRIAEIIWHNLKDFLDLPEDFNVDVANTVSFSHEILDAFEEHHRQSESSK